MKKAIVIFLILGLSLFIISGVLLISSTKEKTLLVAFMLLASFLLVSLSITLNKVK